jgi:hypothetical protein
MIMHDMRIDYFAQLLLLTRLVLSVEMTMIAASTVLTPRPSR